MSTLIPITPQLFSERASALLSAAPDLPGPELARKLASLRGAWRELDPAGREAVGDLASRLSLLSTSPGREGPPPPQLMRIDGEPESAFAAADEREARRALQGLDGLVLNAQPTRIFTYWNVMTFQLLASLAIYTTQSSPGAEPSSAVSEPGTRDLVNPQPPRMLFPTVYSPSSHTYPIKDGNYS